MIDFKETRNQGCWGNAEFDRKKLDELTELINIELSLLKLKRFRLGVLLTDLYASRAYSIEARKYEPGLRLPTIVGNCNSEYFFAYCLDKFGLEKSQVSRYMNIVDEFGVKGKDGKPTELAEKWRDYGYSQLVEMLPLTPEQRENVKPDWSVRRIREYKLSLVATSQQGTNDGKGALSGAKKDKPMDIKSSDDERYTRFKGLTPIQLCDKYIELEQEVEELRGENDRLDRFYKACIARDPELGSLLSQQ